VMDRVSERNTSQHPSCQQRNAVTSEVYGLLVSWDSSFTGAEIVVPNILYSECLRHATDYQYSSCDIRGSGT